MTIILDNLAPFSHSRRRRRSLFVWLGLSFYHAVHRRHRGGDGGGASPLFAHAASSSIDNATPIASLPSSSFDDGGDLGIAPAVVPPSIRRRRAQSPSAISGFGFFDENGDGDRDVGDGGIDDTAVWLFTCTDELIKYTETDGSGFYRFEGLFPSRYYVMIPTPPRDYVFSDAWNGEMDAVGTLFSPGVDNAVNPSNGRTACFELEEGQDKTVSFGMTAEEIVPTTARPVAPPSIEPSNAETVDASIAPTTTSLSQIPTYGPTTEPDATPSASPSNAETVDASMPSGGTSSPPTVSLAPATPYPTIEFDASLPPTATGTELPTTRTTTTTTTTTTTMTTNPTSESTTARTTSPANDGAPSTPPVTPVPTYNPTTTDLATERPSSEPTANPSSAPVTMAPTATPSSRPVTSSPTYLPTNSPSTTTPTYVPTYAPTRYPSARPTSQPTTMPTVAPSDGPSVAPSYRSARPTTMPSVVPSDGPSDGPSSSRTPTLGPTATGSYPPSGAPMAEEPSTLPSAIPSQRSQGDLYGPTATDMRMSIRGIDSLEDEEAWSAATADYIASYFNSTEDDAGVFDVTASIRVVSQTSGDDPLFESMSQANSNGNGDGRGEEDREPQLRQRHRRRRGLQSSSSRQRQQQVIVAYVQTSLWRTSDPESYDDEYVATRPFATREGMDGYLAALRDLSSHYDDVESAGSPKVPNNDDEEEEVAVVDSVQEPPDGGRGSTNPPEEEEEEEKGNPFVTFAMVVVAAISVAALVFVVVMHRRTIRRAEQQYANMEPVGDGPPSLDDDLEEGTIDNASSLALTSDCGQQPPSPDLSSSNMIMLHVVAPPGKLGVVVDTPPSGTPAYVCEVKESSPMIGMIRLEDRVLAVDDEDVQGMSAVAVSRLLASKSRQAERKITVLREAERDDVAVSTTGHSVAATATGAGDDSAVDEVARVLDAEIDRSKEFLRIASAEADAAENAASSSPSSSSNPTAPERQMEIIAPSGRLGVVLVIPETPGPAYVHDVREDSPLYGTMRLGDRILAVDDEDARGMSAVQVSKLLGRKSGQERRRITVLRGVAEEEEEEEDGDDEGGGAARVGDAVAPVAVSESDDGTGLAAAAVSNLSRTSGRGSMSSVSSEKSSPDTASETRFDVIAPPGKLGIVMTDPHEEKGPAYVSDIKDYSPLVGKIFLGDRVVAVDGTDVSRSKAVDISIMLARNSRQPERNIGVMRSDSNDDDDASSATPSLESNDDDKNDASNESSAGSKSVAKIDIVAPPGRLGVGVESGDGGAVYVINVKETCPIRDEIRLGDRVVAIDDVDVRKRKAVEISMLLASSSRNKERKITVTRSNAGDGDTTLGSNDDDQLSKNTRIDVVAQAGKLGLVLDSPPGGGTAFVSHVKTDSPLLGKLRLGDRVVGVDDVDVTEMKAIQVSMLLASSSRNKERKITVSRSNAGDDDNDTTLEYNDQSRRMRIDIAAPAGKLGVSLDSLPGGGAAFVSHVKDDSPLLGKIRVEDRVIAVDDDDVSEMKAIQVSMILGSKSKNPQRKITVLR